MKSILHVIEYVLIRLLEFFARLLPPPVAAGLGECVGQIFRVLLRGRRRLALENLAQAIPELNEKERERIVVGVWRNLGRTAIEFIRAARGEYDGEAPLLKLKDEGRGVIFVSSHFTNWEYTGMLLGMLMKNFIAIARPMKNPYVEGWLQRRRRKAGIKTILHREAVKGCLRALKNKGSVGILVDQNLYTGGEFVNFFGRPAATTTLPALLHLRTGSPIVHSYTLRINGKIRLFVDKPFEFPKFENDQEAIKGITQMINDRIESVIRKYPQNWFWIHNRWKRKPNL